MPPLNPPPQCEKHMERRADDTLDVVKKRLQVSGMSASFARLPPPSIAPWCSC